MRLSPPQTIRQLADLLGAKPVGDPQHVVTGINEIHVVTPGDLVFVDHPKYYDKALHSAATTILIDKQVACPEGKALLISDDPGRDFNRLNRHFNPFQASDRLISTSAVIGEGTVIQPGTFIGHNVQIGRDCLIHANVSIYDDAVIGDRVTIHAGAVLGGDAFYFQRKPAGFRQLYTCGRVILEDDVHLGAGVTIDRGVTGDTTIGKGTKIDNLVQVGHDTVIGAHCLIAAQTGIAGCVVIEDRVTLWGQVGVISGITIGSGAVVLAQAGVGKSLESDTTYFGSPAGEARRMYRELAALRALPGKFREL